MKKKILIFIFICIFSLLNGDILYTENFSGGTWPSGWSYDAYLVDGDTLTDWSGKPNWRVSNDWSSSINQNQPAIVFNWKPRIPEPTNDINTEYELTASSPTIDVGENDAVMVKLDIALKFFRDSDHTNGMLIEANGGDGWLEMLKFEIGPGNFVEIDYRTESFITLITNGTLQLRFKAYGTDSYYIDGWVIDNVNVISLPKLSSVHIESNNSTDNQAAIEGDEVTLSFQSEVPLATVPYVQINSSEAAVLPQGNNAYTSNYTVSQTDPDGPLTFSIDFTSLDGLIEGSTVKSTTDNSKVLIDRTGPPPFNVGNSPNPVGGNIFSGKWNSTNTSIELEVNVPQDSAVIEFDYFEGNSIFFDGFDDFVEINNPQYQFINQFTIESWIKPSSSSDYEGIFSYGNVVHVETNEDETSENTQSGFGFAFFSTGWRFYIQTSTNINWAQLPDASAPTGQWTHLAATYDGTNLKLYKNGSLVNQTDALNGVINLSGAADFNIGYFSHGGIDRYFNGNIDDVRLWNIVRSDLQIKGFRNSILQGDETGLVGYWKFDETSGSIVNDETSNSNNGSINGASLTSLNSPLNFSSPIYDNTVIIGSKYQLRSKIGSNDFENFGELQIITQSDFQNSSKTISASSASFSGVSGYQHNENAQISAVLFDQSGNFSLGDTSQTILQIDLVSNNPTSVNISSDNSNNSSYAKTGDVVTLTMSYDEEIGSTTTTIESNSATDTDLGSEQFKAEYTLVGTEPEGILDFTIDALDYMGNPGSYSLTTDGSQVTFDKTPPELTYVNISSNNADTSWAKVSDSISIAFTSNEIISSTSSSSDFSLSFDGGGDYVDISSVSDNFDGATVFSVHLSLNPIMASFPEDFGCVCAINGVDGVSGGTANVNILLICISQSTGTLKVIAPGNYGFFETSIGVTDGNWHDIAYTNNGTVGKLFLDGILVGTDDTGYSLSSSYLWSIGQEFDGPSITGEYAGLVDNVSVWNIALTESQIAEYDVNNELNGNEVGLVSYWNFNEGSGTIGYDQSTNGNNGIIYNATWNVNNNRESLIPTVSILNQTAIVSDLLNNKFMAVYVPTDSDTEGETAFEIQFSDLAGNEGTPVTLSTNNTKVIFDKTPPVDFTVGLLTPTGGNQVANFWNLTNTGMDIIVPIANDTTLKNGTVQLYAKVGSNSYEILGDISTILSSEINNDKTISVAGELIEGLIGFVEGQIIYIKAIMNDRPGNSTEGSQSLTGILIDETPADIAPISIISNNDNTVLAKVGDTVTVSFTTTEDLTDTTATISGQSALITGIGSNQFKVVYVMEEGDPEGIVQFEISFIDIQGNPLTGVTETTDASQVIFDNTKPTLNPITISSDNLCSSGAIAKLGNIISINFTSLESLLSSFAIVMDDTIAITDLGSSQYQIDYILNDSDIEGDVSFLIRVVDLAGNISEDITSTTDNSNVVFDNTKPVITNMHIESNNQAASTIAIEGNTVTLTFESNESLSSASVDILDSTIVPSENGGVYSASYIIQSSDMGEGGFITFSVDFIDCPGNIGLTDSTTTDDSFVSIDIGPPSMVSVKIFSSNEDSSWAKVDDSVFVYFVANEPLKLDGTPSSSLEIGGNNVNIDAVENTSYQGHYIMTNSDAEGEVSLQISFFDIGGQQGNNGSPLQSTTDNSRVKFDKINPEITSLSFTTNNLYGDSLAKIGDIGTINISLNESIRTISSQLDDIDILLDGNGLEYSYAYTFSDTNNNGQINLNILALDSAGNSDDSLLSRIYFDKIPPSVFNLYEGSIDSDYVFTKFSDSLQLAWSVIESGSGSKRSYIGLGSDSGQVDILDWSLASEITQESAKQLSLNNNLKYYGAVYSEDNVGNISDSLWGNGIIVDLTPPIPGSVWDGFLNEDIDYVADSTSLYVRWNGFTDNQSIHYFEASIGSLDDTTNIATWQKSILQDNIQIMDLDLDRGVQYFAYLRAIDSATNISSVIKSDGVEFDNVPPEIKSIYPLFDSLQVLSVTNTDQIKIDFNKPILKFGLDIISTQDSTVNYELIKRDSGITISILDILPSYEMLSVTLDTAIAFNLLNYSDTIIFRSKLWGDLNNDYKITVEDVLVFNQAWPYSSTDLGPFLGDPPYIYPSPDNQLNLKDLIAFGKMWMWYYHENNSELLFINSFDDENLNAIVENNNFRLSIPKPSYAAELTFFNSNEFLEDLTINNLNANTFKYRFIDSTLNSISFVIADKNGLDSTLLFSFTNKISENFTSSIKYKFIDKDANHISDGEGYIITDIIPDRINIYQNYPNPFNAETIVRYELPTEEDVFINIYDIMGREIYSVSYIKQAIGINRFSWKGHNMIGDLVSSGMYFLKIKAGNYQKRMKMILLK